MRERKHLPEDNTANRYCAYMIYYLGMAALDRLPCDCTTPVASRTAAWRKRFFFALSANNQGSRPGTHASRGFSIQDAPVNSLAKKELAVETQVSDTEYACEPVGEEGAPMRTYSVTRHRKHGCQKKGCILKHQQSHCQHRQSPFCLRRRCLQSRQVSSARETARR